MTQSRWLKLQRLCLWMRPSLLDQSPKTFLTGGALILWFYDPWLPSLPPVCPRCRMWLKVSAAGSGSGLWTGDSGPVLGQHRSRCRGGDQRNVLTWTRGFIVISHDYLSAVWAIKVKATTWTKSINKLKKTRPWYKTILRVQHLSTLSSFDGLRWTNRK